MNYYDFIKKAIERETPNKGLEKVYEDAIFQNRLYRGKDLDEIITDYRKNESKNQKDQRKRITIGRSKHLIRQIGNVFDYLKMMDSPVSNIITTDKTYKDILENGYMITICMIWRLVR